MPKFLNYESYSQGEKTGIKATVKIEKYDFEVTVESEDTNLVMDTLFLCLNLFLGKLEEIKDTN